MTTNTRRLISFCTGESRSSTLFAREAVLPNSVRSPVATTEEGQVGRLGDRVALGLRGGLGRPDASSLSSLAWMMRRSAGMLMRSPMTRCPTPNPAPRATCLEKGAGLGPFCFATQEGTW